MGNPEKTIDASPTKLFFIEMFTKDISLIDCRLDLIDNSVHNAIESSKTDVLEFIDGKSTPKKTLKAEVRVDFTRKTFSISDTCGGISIQDAETDVFRFGRIRAKTGFKGLGVYGIGMKRAFFKLGGKIAVESITTKERFAVDIDVDKWTKAKEWELGFREGSVKKIKD